MRLPAENRGSGRRASHTQTFVAITVGITILGDWLAEHRVTRAGMESTGVYGKPVYYLLEDQLEVRLINAEHLHNIPSRKIDVDEARPAGGVLRRGVGAGQEGWRERHGEAQRGDVGDHGSGSPRH